MKRFLEGLGYVLGGLVVLLLVAGLTLYVLGGRRLGRTHEVQTASLRIPTDSASVARGAHLVAINGCRDCHGENLAGQVMIDAPPFRATAANLTRGRGGIGRAYEDDDWERTIRHGVRPDGRPVIIMPSAAYHALSDRDAADLIAYLKTLPPVDNELPPTEARALGRVLVGAGQLDPAFEVRTVASPASAPPPGPTAAYGAYLAGATCRYCHGEDLRGAQPPEPGTPFAPDLAAAGAWSLEAFKRTLRTGVAPDGRRLDRAMPISMTRHYTDDEVAALHAHFATLTGPAPARAAEG